MPKKYRVKEGHKWLGEGVIVYDFVYADYGCVNEDTRRSGQEHIAVTLDSNGAGNFFTIPVDDLEELPK